jgi:hypothetical protein
MNTVCFTNIYSAIAFALIFAAYVAAGVVKFVLPEKKKILFPIYGALALLHFFGFFMLLALKASYEEILLMVMASSALAFTVAGLKRKEK